MTLIWRIGKGECVSFSWIYRWPKHQKRTMTSGSQNAAIICRIAERNHKWKNPTTWTGHWNRWVYRKMVQSSGERVRVQLWPSRMLWVWLSAESRPIWICFSGLKLVCLQATQSSLLLYWCGFCSIFYLSTTSSLSKFLLVIPPMIVQSFTNIKATWSCVSNDDITMN